MIKIFISPAKIYQVLFFIWIVFIPFKNSIYQIAIGLVITFFLFELFYNKRFNTILFLFKQYKYLIFGFILIFLSMTISNFLGVNAKKIWHIELMFFLRYCLLFFILLYCYFEKHISRFQIVMMIIISLGLQGIDGLYQHFFNIDFISGHIIKNGVKLSGSVFYYNPFGLLVGLGASICLSFLIYYTHSLTFSLKLLLSILLCIFIYTLIFSFSRSAWVSFSLFALSTFLFNYKKIRLNHIGLLISLFALIFFAMLYNESVLIRLQELLHGNSAGRNGIWRETFQAFLQHPYFGYGLNSFKEVLIHMNIYNGIHNSLLEILLYLGLFGFFSFSVSIFLVLREIYIQKSAEYFSFFLYFLCVSQFDHSITSSKILLSCLTLFAFFIFTPKELYHKI